MIQRHSCQIKDQTILIGNAIISISSRNKGLVETQRKYSGNWDSWAARQVCSNHQMLPKSLHFHTQVHLGMTWAHTSNIESPAASQPPRDLMIIIIMSGQRVHQIVVTEQDIMAPNVCWHKGVRGQNTILGEQQEQMAHPLFTTQQKKP